MKEKSSWIPDMIEIDSKVNDKLTIWLFAAEKASSVTFHFLILELTSKLPKKLISNLCSSIDCLRGESFALCWSVKWFWDKPRSEIGWVQVMSNISSSCCADKSDNFFGSKEVGEAEGLTELTYSKKEKKKCSKGVQLHSFVFLPGLSKFDFFVWEYKKFYHLRSHEYQQFDVAAKDLTTVSMKTCQQHEGKQQLIVSQ